MDLRIKNKSFNLLVLVSALVALTTIALFWKIFFSPKKTPSPHPTLSPTPTSAFQPDLSVEDRGDQPEDIRKALGEEYPLRAYTPYISDDFALDYLKPLHLIVFLKKETPELRQEVLDWIQSKGVDPATHQIDWEVKP